MSRPAEPRVPWTDLAEWVRAYTGRDLVERDLADLCGVKHMTTYRWRRQGHLPLSRVEEIADRHRVHPSEITPVYFDHHVAVWEAEMATIDGRTTDLFARIREESGA